MTTNPDTDDRRPTSIRRSQTYRDIESDNHDQLHLDVSTFVDSAWPDVAIFTASDADGKATVTLDREAAANLVHQLVEWLAAGR
ncbi:hypothetical protein [Mycobacterium sp. DL440]|uniref:hypothetical protein n=1 Tax=Mycobacterium sp. DL440 TaxID=2675523 RepID=UPI00141F9893|nr:hypothetical protein [Mycobacterium sp. DL440]